MMEHRNAKRPLMCFPDPLSRRMNLTRARRCRKRLRGAVRRPPVFSRLSPGSPPSSIRLLACYPFLMPGAQEQGDLAAPEDAELVRVLMPSPLGPLGVELLGMAVTRLRIDP